MNRAEYPRRGPLKLLATLTVSSDRPPLEVLWHRGRRPSAPYALRWRGDVDPLCRGLSAEQVFYQLADLLDPSRDMRSDPTPSLFGDPAAGPDADPGADPAAGPALRRRKGGAS